MSVTNYTARHLTTLVRLWIMAIRPRTLTIALVPVMTGSALAYYDSGHFRFAVFLATLLAALLIQAGTNLLNDAADFHRGGDGPDRIGPPRVTASGWIPAPRIAQAAFGCFALAGLAGLYLVWAGGWGIMALGILSLLAAYSYSNGPWPISYTSFGEVFVVAFFGLAAVGGTYYLHSGTL
ncbi:MAG TPA: 1,4-dihydroxy-2-naphthoate octaprenyltransferase, partial [Rhodobacteraceae bacterium]|nr:1,4-dihydroxy-2-naphthoate octaprenyltransferase [Paracoccaceae bacterium]